MSGTLSNVAALEKACTFLENIFEAKLLSFFGEQDFIFEDVKLPTFLEAGCPLVNFLYKEKPTPQEFVIILLALVPHVRPALLGELIKSFIPKSGDFPEIGGMRDESNRVFIPTGQTAAFLLAGEDLKKRFKIQELFSAEHWFAEKNILSLGSIKSGDPILNGKIILDKEYIELFTLGKITRPQLSMEFPAQYIETNLEWNDLVLNDRTKTQIAEIETWVSYNDVFLHDWGMLRKTKPGYRALFYGPPGTGKTLTATLLGKYTGKDVFRIDLSMVVSKYIGETEKNLAGLFNKAQNKGWILFFDEADAIFSKRTNVKDAHDKYANQEVAYLLQRIENYPGLVILASNFKSNIDDAFMRRFHSIIYFPIPKASERRKIWENAFPTEVSFSKDVDFQTLAKQYEITGANIMNIVQYCCLEALSAKDNTISLSLLKQGIEKEYSKEGKMH